MKFSWIIQCREWTDALEKTLKQVQRQMEDACEDYFKDIRSNAIKVNGFINHIISQIPKTLVLVHIVYAI